jgi:hypothetical protein
MPSPGPPRPVVGYTSATDPVIALLLPAQVVRGSSICTALSCVLLLVTVCVFVFHEVRQPWPCPACGGLTAYRFPGNGPQQWDPTLPPGWSWGPGLKLAVASCLLSFLTTIVIVRASIGEDHVFTAEACSRTSLHLVAPANASPQIFCYETQAVALPSLLLTPDH